MKDYTEQIRNYMEREIEVLKKLDYKVVHDVMNLLEETRLNGTYIYICGNGGSAATALHFTGDFNKGVSLNKDIKYNFVCLSDNLASMLAIANDIGYEQIFEQPLHGRLKKGDVLIAISGSGNSVNVVNAVMYAKKCGNKVIGLTGYSGGKLKELSDYRLHVPINNMQITEDLHIIFNHLMMYILAYGEC